MVVGALTHCALCPSVCDLKVTQTNMQCNLIQEHIDWAVMSWKQPKVFVVRKVKGQLITIQ